MLTITNEDNMELMARYPDNYFDLAIVDPPYGISINMNMGLRKGKKKNHNKKDWDNAIPNQEYFYELFRVSKNQIIWGGNYFPLPLTKSWIFWDKKVPKGVDFADGELAWTSFDKTLVKLDVPYSGFQGMDENGKIHPTQKPVKLYKNLLEKWGGVDYKILDTHLGSGSIAIACHDYGFDLTACELDKEYFDKAMERIRNHTNQTKLF
jgi:site-specific DNA-methyltransferase (adenine-specific)